MSQVSERAINAGLASADPEISRLIDQERHRQETHLELIAQPNLTPLSPPLDHTQTAKILSMFDEHLAPLARVARPTRASRLVLH